MNGSPELMRVHDDDGSVLAKKYGPGVTNYYSGSPLNRLSFLREDYAFLSRAFSSPDAQFIVLNDFAPLVQDPATIRPVRLEDFVSVSGPDPFKLSEKELAEAYDSKATTPLIVFLGIREDEVSEFRIREFRGCPWFAVDLTPKGSYADAAQKVIEQLTSNGSTFLRSVRQSTLSSELGKLLIPAWASFLIPTDQTCHSGDIWPGEGHRGLEQPQPVLRGLWKSYPGRPRRLQAHLPADGP